MILRNDLNYYSKENTILKNFRNINCSRNFNNFYDKEELIEIFVYLVCFDNFENELPIIEKYKEISISEIKSLYEHSKRRNS